MDEKEELIKEIISMPTMGFLTVVNENNVPIMTRHFAYKMTDDMSELTIYAYKPDAERLFPYFKPDQKIAAVTASATNAQSLQHKGVYITHYDVDSDAELDFIKDNNKKQRDIMEMFGVAQLIDNWRYEPSVAIKMRIDEIFEQTPRPDTGKIIKTKLS